MYCFIVIFCMFAIYKILDGIVRIPLVTMKGKRVLITGCDTGMGHALALYLDSKQVEVFAGCLTEKGELELKKRASKLLQTVPLDVTSKHSIEQAFKTVKQLTSDSRGLWGLVNNAGISGPYIIPEALDILVYKKVCDVNLFGLIEMTTTFLPLIKKSKGRIVNVSSVAGRVATSLGASYVVSKFGVQGFSDSLRLQMKPFGVSVHILQPGLYLTNMVYNMMYNMRQDLASMPEYLKEEYGQEYCKGLVKRMSKAENQKYNNVDDICEAHEHALFGRFPRARYWVGKDARYLFKFVVGLPEWLSDYFILRYLLKAPIPKRTKRQS